jgi:hypothetical protein
MTDPALIPDATATQPATALTRTACAAILNGRPMPRKELVEASGASAAVPL